MKHARSIEIDEHRERHNSMSRTKKRHAPTLTHALRAFLPKPTGPLPSLSLHYNLSRNRKGQPPRGVVSSTQTTTLSLSPSSSSVSRAQARFASSEEATGSATRPSRLWTSHTSYRVASRRVALRRVASRRVASRRIAVQWFTGLHATSVPLRVCGHASRLHVRMEARRPDPVETVAATMLVYNVSRKSKIIHRDPISLTASIIASILH